MPRLLLCLVLCLFAACDFVSSDALTQVDTDPDTVHVRPATPLSADWLTGPDAPAVFIDAERVPDAEAADRVRALSPDAIASIEVVKGKAAYRQFDVPPGRAVVSISLKPSR